MLLILSGATLAALYIAPRLYSERSAVLAAKETLAKRYEIERNAARRRGEIWRPR